MNGECLNAVDWLAIGAYFALTMGVGVVAGRRTKNAADFFSGGRKVPWWMGAVSSYMAMISCFVFIAYAQIGYEDGLVGLTVFWSTAFAVLAGTFVFARRLRRANLATPLYTLGVIASQFLGVTLSSSIALGAAVVLVYSASGGLWSVLATDVVQCAVLMSAALAVLPLSLNAVDGLGALREAVPDHFSLFAGHRGSLWFLAAYYLVVFVKYNGAWSFVQRISSVRTERDAVKMGLL